MQDGGMSSWDLLDSNVTSLLQQAGINGKDAWDKFVQDDPLQALTLLSSSWNSMNDTIGQYMTDAQTIAANGCKGYSVTTNNRTVYIGAILERIASINC